MRGQNKKAFDQLENITSSRSEQLKKMMVQYETLQFTIDETNKNFTLKMQETEKEMRGFRERFKAQKQYTQDAHDTVVNVK